MGQAWVKIEKVLLTVCNLIQVKCEGGEQLESC